MLKIHPDHHSELIVEIILFNPSCEIFNKVELGIFCIYRIYIQNCSPSVEFHIKKSMNSQ